MPYEWTRDHLTGADESGRDAYELDATEPLAQLTLWPHRSLPRTGFVWTIGLMAVMMLMPLLAVVGSMLLWGLLPFLLAALGALWWAINHTYKTGTLREDLAIFPDRVTLTRTDPDGSTRHWDANPYWTRIEVRDTGGPVENYITLHGGARVVELGAFLSADERPALARDLRAHIARLT